MVKDYKGQEFESYKQMAENYHLTYKTFLWRRKNNWSLEECLTGKTKHKSSVDISKRTDHLGRVYQSVEDLCKAWGVTLNNYHIRKSRGYSLEECLTGIKNIIRDKSRYGVEDHLGNKFESKQKMCEYYNIPYYTYLDRRRRGWSQEKVLTTKVNENITEESRTDHLGNKYKSKNEMLRHYGISKQVFKVRKEKLGWSLEKTLTTPVECRTALREDRTDHKGNVFNSRSEMIKFYGCDLSHFYHRIRKGKTKDEILRECEDRMNRKIIAEKKWIVDNLIYTSPDGTMYYACHRDDGTEEVLSVNEA